MNPILDKNKLTIKLFLLFLPLFTGLFLRIQCLNLRPVWYDEAITIFFAKSGFNYISNYFWQGSNPPFAYYFYSLWGRIFGFSQSSLESVSVIFGVLSIWAIYRIGSRLFSDLTGLIASILLTFSSYHIFVSQQIRGYSMACFFSLMAIDCFFEFLKREKIIYLINWIIFSLLMLATHFYTLFLFAVQIFCLWWCAWGAPKRASRRICFVSKSSLWISVSLISVALIAWAIKPGLFPIYSRPYANFSDLSLVVKSIGFLSLPLVGFSFSVVTIYFWKVYKNSSYSEAAVAGFMSLWLLVSVVVPYFFSQAQSSFFYVRYYIFSHLAWVLLTARAIDTLFKGMRKVLVVSGFIFLLTFLLADYYAECNEKNQLKRDFEMAEHEFLAGDILIHENGWTFGPSFFYHGGRIPEFFLTDEFGLPNLSSKKLNPQDMGKYKRIWLFAESPERFAPLINQDWFQKLNPQLIKESPSKTWFLFEIRGV